MLYSISHIVSTPLLILTNKLIEPAEHLVVPLQATSPPSAIELTGQHRTDVPVSVIYDPMVLIREDDQASRNVESAQNKNICDQSSSAVVRTGLLLKCMEGSDALGLREPVILAAVNDQLRCRPFVGVFSRVKS